MVFGHHRATCSGWCGERVVAENGVAKHNDPKFDMEINKKKIQQPK